jgi:DNA-binding LytR/AlgR family response regulator
VRHVLNYDETLYLEASHQYTIVHLPGTSFRVRSPLTTVLEGLPPFFVRVHRSYAVNARLVVGMKGPEVQLVDGSTVRVPAKRTREMREALHEAAAESALHEESLS